MDGKLFNSCLILLLLRCALLDCTALVVSQLWSLLQLTAGLSGCSLCRACSSHLSSALQTLGLSANAGPALDVLRSVHRSCPSASH